MQMKKNILNKKHVELFQRIAIRGLVINAEQCQWSVWRTRSPMVIIPSTSILTVVQKLPLPRHSQFLAPFWRPLRHNISHAPHPRRGCARNVKILSEKHCDLFNKVQGMLSKVIVLGLPVPDCDLSFMLDVSTVAVLYHSEGCNRQPLAFFSNPFTATEKR